METDIKQYFAQNRFQLIESGSQIIIKGKKKYLTFGVGLVATIMITMLTFHVKQEYWVIIIGLVISLYCLTYLKRPYLAIFDFKVGKLIIYAWNRHESNLFLNLKEIKSFKNEKIEKNDLTVRYDFIIKALMKNKDKDYQIFEIKSQTKDKIKWVDTFVDNINFRLNQQK